MAISDMSGVASAAANAQQLIWSKANVTAVAGRMCSLWSGAGAPGVGSTTLGQAATGTVPTDASTGAMPYTNAPSGQMYLLNMEAQGSGTGTVFLWDLVWTWGSGGSGWSVTTTTAQNTSSPTALTRPDANGADIEAWFEVLATMGAGAATPVLSYTDQDGNTGNTTGTLGYNSAAIIGSMYQFPLATGDTGVRSIQSLTTSVSMTSGTARINLMRRLATVPITVAQVEGGKSWDRVALPKIYDDSCLMITLLPTSTTSGPLQVKLDIGYA